VGCSSLILHFHNEIPFLPFQQLLAVLPERSKQFLPSIFHSLMTPDSPIADFYPSDFFVDLKGKK
jgi:5'-3' exonuclease